MTDLATLESEAASFEAAIADRVAPAAGGILSRVGSLGSLAGSLSIPGLGQAQLALAVLTSPWTWRALGALGIGVALLVAHHRGYEAASARDAARTAQVEAARQKLAADKATADAATVTSALRQETETARADEQEIAKLRARIAKAPITKSCPPILLDTIRGLGGKR